MKETSTTSDPLLETSHGTRFDAGSTLDSLIDAELPSLLATYMQLHAMPELSGQEEKTSALLAQEFRSLGYAVTEGIGKYEHHSWPGYGIVALLQNGAGPTVLVRADMDALPVEEKTGLPYASQLRGINRDGKEVAVMHACGHDVHVAVLLGTARLLARLKGAWRGSVVLIGQPGEEGGGGAQAMLNDGAYELCPQPDYALALHSTLRLEAGSIGYVPGNFMASFSELEVTVRGVGAHGSAPEFGKDPILMAAQLILALQSIVSREKSAFDPAVLTVGSVHGGTASNIIPEEVKLQLSIRTYDDRLRDRILASVERIARGVALTAGVPEDRAPVVTLKASHQANYNDPDLTERVARALKQALGDERVNRSEPVMVSEDFGSWGLGGRIPTCMFWLGGADPVQFRASQLTGVSLPSHHSPLFAPLPEPTIRCGVKAMSAAVLDLLAR
ncbi:MAG: peptidase [Geobacteraceae bacterium GWC2_58_44]|nr:MAG: peptidase [Geobacteraceae bacterium GWC2_58_44]HBG04449.1 amidohydrolase [Geobacter sp.]